VASQELLCSGDYMSNYDGCSKRVDHVLIVRVENQTLCNLALKADDGG